MRSPSSEPERASPKLRVLVVNQYFPPDTAATAATTADLVEALQDTGHKVSVLCGRPSYDPDATSPWRPLRRESTTAPISSESVPPRSTAET